VEWREEETHSKGLLEYVISWTKLEPATFRIKIRNFAI